MELKKDFPSVHATYDKLLSALVKDLEALESTASPNGASAEPSSQSTTNSLGSQGEEKAPKTTELQERRSEYGLVYIMYMRFSRRAEGLQSLRKVFGKARRDRWAPWEVYEASGAKRPVFVKTSLCRTDKSSSPSTHGVSQFRRQASCQQDL
jgi:cleavage stimulation factor subunit 3